MILKAFVPSGAKIVGLLLIFALIVIYSFIPFISNPQLCFSGGCTADIGYPLKFLTYASGESTQSFMNLETVNFIVDLLIFYFGLSLLSLISNLGRRKNVPNSNSGGRDSSTPEQAGV